MDTCLYWMDYILYPVIRLFRYNKLKVYDGFEAIQQVKFSFIFRLALETMMRYRRSINPTQKTKIKLRRYKMIHIHPLNT